MSTQKGNTTRTRPQKYQNKTKFKNDLHDKSKKMKVVNDLEIENVCARCKDVIEWKIKYKKYKPLKSPATCVQCHQKTVKHAYHVLCASCSRSLKVCPKCKLSKELVTSTNVKSVDLLNSSEMQEAVRSLSERRRRTLYRLINKPLSLLKTEEDILSKIKELSVGSVGDKYSDDSKDLDDSDELESAEEEKDEDDE